GRGVEYGLELALLGPVEAQRELGRLVTVVDPGGDEHQHERALAVPWNREEAAFHRHLVAAVGGDGEGAAGSARLTQIAALDEQVVETAGLGQLLEAAVAGPIEEGAVGVKQVVEAIDQDAHRNAVEQRPFG